MELMERAQEARRSFARDRLEHRLDEAMRDNDRLRDENDHLRSEVEREERDREHLFNVLEGRSPRRGGRIRRTMMLGIGLGAAYVAGTKAGRERYEEMRRWFDRMRGRAMEMQGDAQQAVAQTTEETAAKVADRLQQTAGKAGDAIETGGERAATKVRSTGRDVADATSGTGSTSSTPTTGS